MSKASSPNSWLSRSNLPTLALAAAVAVGAVSVSTRAVPTAAPAGPSAPIVGVVNLETLVNGLSELKERNDAVRVKGQEIQKGLDLKRKEIDGIDAQLKMLADKKTEKRTPEEMREIVDKRLQIAEKNATLEAEFKAAQQRIELEKGGIIRDLYVKSLAAIETFAKKEGFDAVLLDDRSRDIPDLATNSDMSSVIEGRRILYANDSLNVTERIRTIMENEWAAKGKK